jgi:hypothetical protein
MTFYEAAIEVLREAGRPLHHKKIAEIAVKRNLLSHVGKAPEETMLARLAQEVRKGPGETLVEQTRPGIFALKQGVDPTDARETLSFRKPTPPAPEAEAQAEAEVPSDEAATTEEAAAASPEVAAPPAPARRSENSRRRGGSASAAAAAVPAAPVEPSVPAAVAEESTDDAEAPAVSASVNDLDAEWDPADVEPLPLALGEDEAEGPESGAVVDAPAVGGADRKRRRRGRRGGKGRGRDEDATTSGDTPQREPAQAEASDGPPVPEPSAASADRDARRQRQGRPPRPAGDASRSELDDGASDIERAIFRALWTLAPGAFMRADEIGRSFDASPVGSVKRLGVHAIRTVVRRSNDRRAADGRPPLFEEPRIDCYALAAASGADLARSYASLNEWQETHRGLLEERLSQSLRQIGDQGLANVVTLLLDRMGYRNIVSHGSVDGEVITFSASSPRGLARAQVAIRVTNPRQQVRREQVTLLRGNLHVYGATEAVIISLGGFSEDAQANATVANLAPIALIDRSEFAKQLIQQGIGVGRFNVEVSFLDETFLRELRG